VSYHFMKRFSSFRFSTRFFSLVLRGFSPCIFVTPFLVHGKVLVATICCAMI
jgi:hypothetical protein